MIKQTCTEIKQTLIAYICKMRKKNPFCHWKPFYFQNSRNDYLGQINLIFVVLSLPDNNCILIINSLISFMLKYEGLSIGQPTEINWTPFWWLSKFNLINQINIKFYWTKYINGQTDKVSCKILIKFHFIWNLRILSQITSHFHDNRTNR